MNGKILIVDDEKGIQDLFRFILEPEGFIISIANDGLEAVDMVKNDSFDMVFLDVHMPRMRGPEALKAIKEIRPQQIVIIVSSSSDPDFSFEEKAKEYGAFDCYYKPFDIDEILKVVERALDEKKGIYNGQ